MPSWSLHWCGCHLHLTNKKLPLLGEEFHRGELLEESKGRDIDTEGSQVLYRTGTRAHGSANKQKGIYCTLYTLSQLTEPNYNANGTRWGIEGVWLTMQGYQVNRFAPCRTLIPKSSACEVLRKGRCLWVSPTECTIEQGQDRQHRWRCPAAKEKEKSSSFTQVSLLSCGTSIGTQAPSLVPLCNYTDFWHCTC